MPGGKSDDKSTNSNKSKSSEKKNASKPTSDKKTASDRKATTSSSFDSTNTNKSKIIKDPNGKAAVQETAAQTAAKTGRRQAPGNSKNEDKDKKNAKNAKKKDKTGKKVKAKPKKKGWLTAMLAEMGIGSQRIVLNDAFAIEAAQALDLHQYHLRIMRAKFDKIDIDGSGNIDIDEFLEAIGEHRSPFTDKLFATIDIDDSGTIEFEEYIRVLATYCMFTKDEILRFCFECYDVDGSGTIDEKEFIELCKTVNNAAPAFPANFRRALEEFDVNEDGLIDYEEFLQLDRRYPLILFPAFRLQDTMQKNSLGEMAWLKINERYTKEKRLEEYKATHGGKLPPDPPLVYLGKLILPCIFRERVHVKLGADMEARHRANK